MAIEKYRQDAETGLTTKREREFNKELFNSNLGFFEFLFKHWMNNPVNGPEIERFYSELKTLFKKVAPYQEINPSEWK